MRKILVLTLTLLASFAIVGTANAYCVSNNTGQSININRTNCNLPGDQPAFGCEYKVKSANTGKNTACELNRVSSKHKTSHLWVFNAKNELLCSVNIKNKGERLQINSTTASKKNCEIISL